MNQVKVFEEEIIKVFNPQTVNIQELADSCKGLKIDGVEDKDGYEKVFESLQKLKKARTDLTKFAKSLRDEFTAKNRKIKEIENDYLGIIQPVEDDLKAQREEIDKIKKREERKILLPGRQEMLKKISVEIPDEELLDMDEKNFSIFYTGKKELFDQEQEKIKQAEEEKERVEAEMKKREDESAKRAKEEAERKAQEEIEKVKREAEEKERKRIEEEKRAKEEAERIKKEKDEERKKAEKNKKFKEWKESLELTEEDKIEQNGNTFVAYKKVGEITIN